MPRLSVTLTKAMHTHLSSMAELHHTSIGQIINQLLQAGLLHHEQNIRNDAQAVVSQHCQQLIIQMNALIKNMAAEILKFDHKDFEELRRASINKCNELIERKKAMVK